LIDQSEKRVSAWDYINPISTVKFAYGSPLGAVLFNTYGRMAVGRGFTFPGILPANRVGGRALRFADSMAAAGDVLWTNSQGISIAARMGKAARGTARGFLFGMEDIGVGNEGAIREAVTYAYQGKAAWRKRAIWNATMRNKEAKGLENYLAKEGITALSSSIVEKAGAVTVARAGLVLAGRVMNPIMDVLAIGQVVAFAAETAFKGIKATSELLNRSAERAYRLDLGGELTRGFLNGQAVTERQRALQAIQASHLSGRRMMGNEASLAHR
jgi:hypothetical protein